MKKITLLVLICLLLGCSKHSNYRGFSVEDKYKSYAIEVIQCFQKDGYILQNYGEFIYFLKGDGNYNSMALLFKNTDSLEKAVAANRRMFNEQYIFQYAADRYFIQPWMDHCEYFRELWTDPLSTKPSF